MAPSFLRQLTTGIPAAVRANPPIPFTQKVNKTLSETKEKGTYITLDFSLDDKNANSKYDRKYCIFRDSTVEDWILWLIAYRKIEKAMPLDSAQKQL